MERVTPETVAAQHVREVLVALRKERGLTQAQVAERMGVSQPTVSQFESEGGDVLLSGLWRYAGAVGAQLVVMVEPVTEEAPSLAVYERSIAEQKRFVQDALLRAQQETDDEGR